jgi:hypothetical protein
VPTWSPSSATLIHGDHDAILVDTLITYDQVEGNELRVLRIGQADTIQSTALHVPSLAAVVTGDLAYNGGAHDDRRDR